MKSGDLETKDFYDEEGWKPSGTQLLDAELFGVKEDGPIRRELKKAHIQRRFNGLKKATGAQSVLECGCGGNPSTDLLEVFSHYTGVDFSATGIGVSKGVLEQENLPHTLQVADVCHLPFEDAAFDAVYSAHMIYHISDPDAQAAALKEMVRVTKPGGAVVLVTVNPRPLLFPFRFIKRVLSDFGAANTKASKGQRKAVLPYRPMKLSWYRDRLKAGGALDIRCYGLPSTYINQNISEFGFFGKSYWQALRFLDLHYPKASAFLGNYVVVCLTKDESVEMA